MDYEELCQGKVRHLSAKAAHQEADRGKEHRVYLCAICYGWHSGHKPKFNKPLRSKKHIERYIDYDDL